jgi:hypothetical protein
MSTPPADPHALGPGLLPTPYTPDQIRDNSPDGRTCRTLVEPRDDAAYVRVSRFVDPSEDTTTMERWQETPDGTRVGEVESVTIPWFALQRHAAFLIAATETGTETITTPLGTLDCLRFVVRDGTETTTFWFATARPGMPVRIVSEEAGVLTETATLVTDEVT